MKTDKRKSFELFFIEFALFVYTNYIVEDFDIYKKWAKPIVYVGWLYRAAVIWLFSPIFLPEFLFKRSNLYKTIQAIQNSPEFKAQMAKMMHMTNFSV